MEEVITQNKQELERLEGIIRENIGGFYVVGLALMRIRDQKHYHDLLGYETFEAYCKSKWDMSKRHVYRLMDSCRIIDMIKSDPLGHSPVNERQVRPLTLLPADQQLIAWQEAVETAPDGRITGAHVYKIVKGMTMATEKPKQDPHARLVTEARDFATMAISQLERMRSDDPRRAKELGRVAAWIKANQ